MTSFSLLALKERSGNISLPQTSDLTVKVIPLLTLPINTFLVTNSPAAPLIVFQSCLIQCCMMYRRLQKAEINSNSLAGLKSKKKYLKENTFNGLLMTIFFASAWSSAFWISKNIFPLIKWV